MKRLISFTALFVVHTLSRVFYRTRVEWIAPRTPHPWRQLEASGPRLIVFLNHTSLYEPILIASVPYHFLWYMAGRLLLPGADKTLDRPIVGRFYKMLTPGTVSISRKRDNTWETFLSLISPETVVMIAAEGRMMRRTGLDSKGRPMSVRGGVGDILNVLSGGSMLICYSGGLHHVQAPGERWPRIFKTIRINYEMVDIAEYKKQMQLQDMPLKMAVARDLEARMKIHCPPAEA